MRWIRECLLLGGLTTAAVSGGVLVGQWWKSRAAVAEVEAFVPAGVEGLPTAAVIMLGSKKCPACARARTWLEQNGVHFTELDVDDMNLAQDLAGQIKLRIVPTFLVGSVRINGFYPEHLRAALATGGP